MEESAPSITPTETVVVFLLCVIFAAVAIASYRRSRCLSGYRIWASVIIAVIAGTFWVLWLMYSLIDRKEIRRAWREYYTSRISRAA